MSADLSGALRILVVEDHWLVAMQAARMLEEQGCEVLGPYGTVEEAAPIARTADMDGAILDVNLGEETSIAIARILDERGIPYALATGYNTEFVPTTYRTSLCLNKPYSQAMVATFLNAIGRLQSEATAW